MHWGRRAKRCSQSVLAPLSHVASGAYRSKSETLSLSLRQPKASCAKRDDRDGDADQGCEARTDPEAYAAASSAQNDEGAREGACEVPPQEAQNEADEAMMRCARKRFAPVEAV